MHSCSHGLELSHSFMSTQVWKIWEIRVKPELHSQLYDPGELRHTALLGHILPKAHSSMSFTLFNVFKKKNSVDAINKTGLPSQVFIWGSKRYPLGHTHLNVAGKLTHVASDGQL